MEYRPAIASMSLGRAWLHSFEDKMRCASQAGFVGIEIFYEDLLYLARSLSGIEDDSIIPNANQQLKAARQVRSICSSLGLTIIGLQPFLFYEGLIDRAEHDRLIEKLHLWFRLVTALGTDIIQIPTNFLPSAQLATDIEVIVSDLRQVADLGLAQDPPIRFAYENICWGTRIDTWEKAWAVVEAVDRPNFGMCLDTFNIAGKVWADPATEDGRTVDADEELRKSLIRLVKTVDIKKVFYIQVVDAEKQSPPLREGHEYHVKDQPSRMSWSRNARCFMYEQERGGYLPVEEVARVIIEKLGYKGFVSLELFSRTMSDPDPSTPRKHAERGIASWHKLVKALKLAGCREQRLEAASTEMPQASRARNSGDTRQPEFCHGRPR
ncbi:xylose isomerase-like protein [Myriangium duriaei CBS 260.36]|uniref:Xylose isomerase-like protein n=1 Tax=Myriangium duriaei CBS 260.36 TaxID=1168546 RepID=A0A9P4IXD2_9PEZI|nr:xylose isomerase-like protein [Myriangium duriaei CBS 260.36]